MGLTGQVPMSYDPINSIFSFPVLYVGDDLAFSINLYDYSPSIYTLNYTFAMRGETPFTITSTAGTFDFTVANAVTALWTAGIYTVTAFLLDGTGKKTTLAQSEVTVRPDLSQVATGDPRSANRIALDDVEAALAAGAGSDVSEYTVAGTTVKKNRAGLMTLRAYFLKRVRAEQGINAIGTYKWTL